MMIDSESEPTTSSDSSPQDSEPKRKPVKRGAKRKSPRKIKSASKPAKKAAKRCHVPAGQSKDPAYALVFRPGPELYKRAWRKVARLQKKDPSISMSSWLHGLISRAAK